MKFEGHEPKNDLIDDCWELRFKITDCGLTKDQAHMDFIAIRDSVRSNSVSGDGTLEFIVMVDTYLEHSLERLTQALVEVVKMARAGDVIEDDDEENECDCNSYYSEYLDARAEVKKLKQRVAYLEKLLSKSGIPSDIDSQ